MAGGPSDCHGALEKLFIVGQTVARSREPGRVYPINGGICLILHW